MPGRRLRKGQTLAGGPSRLYGSYAWKRLRLVILARDRYECQVRLPGCTVVATAVDHIVSPREGGAALDPSNLRASCGSCNSALRNRRTAQLARRMREQLTGQAQPEPSPTRRRRVDRFNDPNRREW